VAEIDQGLAEFVQVAPGAARDLAELRLARRLLMAVSLT
jgi:hypothetical protein